MIFVIISVLSVSGSDTVYPIQKRKGGEEKGEEERGMEEKEGEVAFALSRNDQ